MLLCEGENDDGTNILRRQKLPGYKYFDLMNVLKLIILELAMSIKLLPFKILLMPFKILLNCIRKPWPMS